MRSFNSSLTSPFPKTRLKQTLIKSYLRHKLRFVLGRELDCIGSSIGSHDPQRRNLLKLCAGGLGEGLGIPEPS